MQEVHRVTKFGSGARQSRTQNIPSVLWLVPLILLLGSILRWPAAYDLVLRLVVCSAATLLAYGLLGEGMLTGLGWTFLGLAVLYNPVLRLHFDRDVWCVINVVAAAPFGLLGFLVTLV